MDAELTWLSIRYPFSNQNSRRCVLRTAAMVIFGEAAIAFDRRYFNQELIEVNLALSLVPESLTAAMIAANGRVATCWPPA